MEHFGLESLDDLPGVDELEGCRSPGKRRSTGRGDREALTRLPLEDDGGGARSLPESPRRVSPAEAASTTVVTLSGRGSTA